jgi:ribosomal protein L7Ae-like RNA K-turn-binding protein
LIDRSNEFINEIDLELSKLTSSDIKEIKDRGNVEIEKDKKWSGMQVVKNLCTEFNVSDFKKVKPGIGETTRVLLRRVPDMVLVNNKINMNDPDIQHILLLCKEKNVKISHEYNLENYKAIGIIKELSADA